MSVNQHARGRNRSEATRRAFEILFAFSPSQPRLTPPELAKRTGIPLPTTYRYVALLRDMGLLGADVDGRLYLSPTFMALGRTAEAADVIAEIAAPFMDELAAATRETVLLVRMVAGAAVCVRRIDSLHRLRISFEPGQPLALEHGASGKVLFASLPQDEIDARLEHLAKTEPERAKSLAGELPVIAERGWASSEEEIDEGMWAVSCAVRRSDQTVAGLTIPIPLIRLTDEARESLRKVVCATAAEISASLEATKP